MMNEKFNTNYHQALEHWLDALADQGVFTTDPNLNIISWNHWLEIHSGLSASETIGHNLFEVYPTLVKKGIERFYRQALNGQVVMLSQRLHRYLLPMSTSAVQHQLSYMQQSARIGPLISESKIVGTITVIHDVTERVIRETQLQDQIEELERTDAVLRSTQAKLQHLLASSPAILYTCQENNTDQITLHMTFISDNVLEQLGYQPNQFINQPNFYFEHIHPDDTELVLPKILHLGKTGHQIIEHRFLHADCSYRWLRNEMKVIDSLDGNIEQVVGAMYDITDRKEAEAQIEEQAALIGIAKDAIMVKDLEDRILFWNPSAEKLYGWKASEIIGEYANKKLSSQIYDNYYKLAKKNTIENGEWQGELHKINKNGMEIIVSSSWTLVRDSKNYPKSILTVDTDITEKKLLEAQFLRVQRMESIGTLASGIAHDLNNILSPILAAVHLLKMDLPDEKRDQILTMLENNTIRGADLVKQVLSFAKGLEGERTIIQVRHIVEEVRLIADETFPKTITVVTNVPRELWLIYGDPTQLHQILMNLCVNARDAMPNGGTLKIYGENVWIDENYAKLNLDSLVGAYICITVKDTGTGIHPDHLNKIFEPFFTTKEISRGTGLGLSTVMGIVKSHGGFIQVASQLGEGTQFKIYLPAAPENHAETIPEIDFPQGQGELILLVDDELVILEISQTILETNNYRVITAKNGIEALARYTQYGEQINLVLLNMMMPGMDGKTTLKYLRSISPHLKVIGVSGWPSHFEDDMAVKQELVGFLSKPYTSQELLKILDKALHSPSDISS
ncbi:MULTISPECIES: hybrid sensor histidine kinase/response regulator [Planktothricoides]|uniref:histidine kinase n=1 Tax=Planktothricoides raciborskii FACHB-1370 TaxID=2949576 RepID=A0ABR8EHP9_9CYAN|nr:MULTISPECIES: PAS domain S-box protein [Planktothricoides]KOR38405.1 histidine kinase [Planktothricoides sp. SR001]MBD2546386.1 PAS domain S-box protein [Planktothricoides raciborskii FACHB-1370]MBD2584784.1 PAS domain S-box protein [Planktothricoides raciborskii FACHB-1261]